MRYPCCTSTSEGQTVLVICAETGHEGLWSPSEAGTFASWEDEHERAHDRKRRDDDRREMARMSRRWALHTYRTTEPGDPRRRGIGAYL